MNGEGGEKEERKKKFHSSKQEKTKKRNPISHQLKSHLKEQLFRVKGEKGKGTSLPMGITLKKDLYSSPQPSARSTGKGVPYSRKGKITAILPFRNWTKKERELVLGGKERGEGENRRSDPSF